MNHTHPKIAALSADQVTILMMLGVGMIPKAIGPEMSLSPKTIEHHIAGTDNPRSIVKIIGVPRSELQRFAVENKLVKPGDTIDSINGRKAATPGTKPVATIKTTGDLAQALFDAAALTAAGTANLAQVNALCVCSQTIVNLARMEMDVQLMVARANGGGGKGGDGRIKLAKVPWLLGSGSE